MAGYSCADMHRLEYIIRKRRGKLILSLSFKGVGEKHRESGLLGEGKHHRIYNP